MTDNNIKVVKRTGALGIYDKTMETCKNGMENAVDTAKDLAPILKDIAIQGGTVLAIGAVGFFAGVEALNLAAEATKIPDLAKDSQFVFLSASIGGGINMALASAVQKITIGEYQQNKKEETAVDKTAKETSDKDIER